MTACVLPFVAGAQDTQTTPPWPTKTVERSPFLLPEPDSHVVSNRPLPPIPAGWQIINIESVIQNGNSVQAVLVYLWKPATRQSSVMVVVMNP